MVSFQCHACGDVVKKPKLDTHRGRCQSGFDCIDCHTTFSGPAEYKGHTSCITEAEKYQKSLYKGPKIQQNVSAPRNNYPKSAVSTTYNSVGDHGGYGGHRNGPRWGRSQFQRNNATGANDTPLGTPTRVTPVPIPPLIVPTILSHAQTSHVEKKEDGVKETTEERATKKKARRDKKRKSTLSISESIAAPHTNGDEPPSKKPKVDPVSIPLATSSPAKVDEQRKDKKSKNAKKKKALKDTEESEKQQELESIGVAESIDGRVKDPEASGKNDEATVAEEGDKSKKRKRDETARMEVDVPVKKKKKKSKKDADSMNVDVSHQTDAVEKRKKKKKKSGAKDKSAAPVDLDTSGKEKKPKKEDKYGREKEKRQRKAKLAVNMPS